MAEPTDIKACSWLFHLIIWHIYSNCSRLCKMICLSALLNNLQCFSISMGRLVDQRGVHIFIDILIYEQRGRVLEASWNEFRFHRLNNRLD